MGIPISEKICYWFKSGSVTIKNNINGTSMIFFNHIMREHKIMMAS